MLVVGSIVGVQIGQKLGEQIDSSGLKALLAILLLVVGIIIAYDTFFAEEIQKETIIVWIRNLFIKMPLSFNRKSEKREIV